MRAFILSAALLLPAPMALAAEADLELWRLDCGQIAVHQLNMFSDTLDYPDQAKDLTVSCYLIRHGDSYMLWDVGLPATMLNAAPDPSQPASPRLDRLISEQLAQIGIAPAQIEILAISHNHFDHLGQAADFPGARLLIGAADWDGLKAETPALAVDPALVKPWLDGAEVQPVSGDLDIFGDGSVTMLAMPGHTPGETALLLRLPQTGPVLLAGDVAHFGDQLAHDRVPPFNASRADSLASMDRLRDLAAATGALTIIGHEPADIGKLPAFPASAR